MGLGSVALVALFFMLVAPKAAHAVQESLVQLVNTTANPAIVSDMNDPGRIPYQSSIYGTTQSNCGVGNECFFIFPTVPAGHRLVIQHVSGFIQATPGAVPALVGLPLSNNQDTTSFLVTGQSTVDAGLVAFDQPVLVYVDEGLSPRVAVELASAPAGTNAVQSAFLSGYLLDCSAAPCSAIAK
jgi:hypothetical protein